jgi:YfiH family protein
LNSSAWRLSGGWLRLPSLEKRTKSVLGVTTRALGDMKDRAAFARALRKIGLDPKRAAGGKQVHGRRVRWAVSPSKDFSGAPGTDGVATASPGLALRVYAADCVPVFLIDGRGRALALVHAGWRGTVKGILGRGVALLKKKGVPARDLWVALGPHIRPCCYEVGEDVARHFKDVPGAAKPRPGAPGKFSLDLSRALAAQARRAGVPAARFIGTPFCTAHHPRFFSFRREKTEKRLAAFAALLRRPAP